jgi:hypothetical protein
VPKGQTTYLGRSASKKKILSAAELTKIILNNRQKDRTDKFKETEIKNKQFSKEIKSLSKIVKNAMESYSKEYDTIWVENAPFHKSIINVRSFSVSIPIISLEVKWLGSIDEELQKIIGTTYLDEVGVEYQYILDSEKPNDIKKGIWRNNFSFDKAEENFKNHISCVMADIIDSI